MEYLADFVFLYPVLMSIVWMVGGIYFYLRYEQKSPSEPILAEYPLVSVLVPAHNEGPHIVETIQALAASDYPNFEIIVVSDGSTDDTMSVLREQATIYQQLRILELRKNLGKANALNFALLMAGGEYIVTIDADCLLDSKAIKWLVHHFLAFPRVGAVTGNPRVRNRTTLLAKIQAAEYASVVGLIKRTQRLLGKVLTVSGVIAAFRRKAVLDAGLWSPDMITDDIDLTWKLEKRFWAVHYELNAIGWILVPETFSGLWKQRVRWAQGGIEVIRRYRDIWTDWRTRRMWPLYIDYVLSLTWAAIVTVCTAIWVLESLTPIPDNLIKLSPIPLWYGSIVAFVCLVQFIVSLCLDRKYDPSITRLFFWIIWYPSIYWIFNAAAAVCALPKGLTKKFGSRATWVSPDRGLQVITEKQETPT